MSTNPNRKYTVAEAGVRLKHGVFVEGVKGFSGQHIYNLISAGLLRPIKLGAVRYLTEQEIRNYEAALNNGDIDGWVVKR